MNNVNGTSTMGHDTIMAQSNGSSNSNGYGSDTWTSMSPYSQSPYSASPLTEYPSFGAFVSHGSYSAPPLITPATSAPPVDPPRLPTQHEKSRKTLTTEQKRAMCQFHEDNPGTRQADIGARFGVERSTVSKVLRHKDQYLKRDQEPENPAVKRGKGKHPDFDRTLSNYVRRQQQRGFKVSDEEIMEQARLFAHASGNQENVLNGLTSSWLQKFKQKHGIGGAKLTRRASEANIPDSARLSTLVTKNNSSQDILSPTSPTGNISPLSGSRSDEDAPIDGIDFDFTYKHPESQSTTSLSSDLRDNPASSFSGTMSPTGTFTFSPDPNVGGFPMDQLRGADFQPREKRSNTFPSLNIDYVNQVSGSTEPMTPRHIPSSTAPSSALESPQHELQGAPFSIDTSVNSPPPTLRRSSSNSSITRSTATCPTPVDSSPVSPSQEDARRAAQTLLTYIQTAGNFDSNDYMSIVQLTKKLKIHQHQGGRPSIGGLSRIPEGDVEAPALISAKMETT
ncbi:hypothetical protein CEP54_004185 [Fusarium duplospermum]|uniref:HTH CENPB-type domain-containing protein n=1 Tax=Fusarium duplospermum TaxID=1325734 RepID=A0A428QJZ1_9HYPO|nr:hypothetical protein CEP54_004185 [Fusarium duplospermum]